MVSSPLHLTATLAPTFVKTTSSSGADFSNNFFNGDPVTGFFEIPINANPGKDSVFRTPPRETAAKVNLSLENATLKKSPGHHRSQSSPNPPTTSNRIKSVGFDRIQVRRYSIVMGDHPCCAGIPVSLGWDYSPEHNISVDEYEAHRSPRRSREKLKLSSAERKELLSSSNVSENEMKRAERKLYRERNCQRKNHTKLCAAFFSEQPDESVQPQHEPEAR
jgi:hypothetical protein